MRRRLSLLLFIALGIQSFIFSTGAPGAESSTPGVPSSVAYPSSTGAAPSKGPTKIGAIPTPDTLPLQTGTATNTSIPVPVGEQKSLGRYRKKGPGGGEVVNIASMLHDRYKQSVVRVVAKDLAGNVLAKAMGVGIGRNAQFIATPLSIVLGSSRQWADKIEITHFAGNKYEAQIALIDEEKNLVLLAPEANPAPIVFTREINERPQIDIFTIAFDLNPDGSIASAIQRGRVAAANPETGLLSISPYTGSKIDDNQAGTAIIDSEGNLVGMLLPGGRGVLSSTLQRSVAKAQKSVPLEPRMIGVILGRGVLVDPKLDGAFKTIQEALDAIKNGTAPKTDPARYNPAKNRAVAPKDTDKVVIKVMPGTYREKKQLSLPSHLSLSGSGPGQTTIVAPNPNKPAILIQNAENVIVAGFRIVPAPLQNLSSPALIISKGKNVTLIGNVFEAKGGVAAWVNESRKVIIQGNTFARGTARGLSCDKSDIKVDTNAFVGDWPIALSLDKDCTATVTRSLFLENKTSISASGKAGMLTLQKNTFVRSSSAVKLNGSNQRFQLQDNVFFECSFGLTGVGEVNTKNIGRNAAWRSKFMARSKNLTQLDIVKTEPVFQAPDLYDFRIKPGKGHTGSALLEEGSDLGAFQRSDFLGPWSGALARSLSAVANDEDLASSWGLAE
jgi:hypothetical protein